MSANPIRDAMLVAAVNQARKENAALDLPAIAARLPADFDADELEVTEAVAATNPASEAYDLSVSAPVLTDREPLSAVAADTQNCNVADLPSLQEAEQTVINLRITLRNLGDALKVKRAALAKALAAWQHNGTPITPDQLLRDNARHQHEMRVAAKAGHTLMTADVRPKANSYIDRANGRGGSGDDFCRYRMQTGHRRGAFPGSAQGRRVKLPSQM